MYAMESQVVCRDDIHESACPCVSAVDAVGYPNADTVTIYEVMYFNVRLII